MEIVAPAPAPQHHLYRHFSTSGELLYVGVSLAAVNRLAQHRHHSHWYTQIARVEIESFATRELALEAETAAIRKENPKFNIAQRRRANEYFSAYAQSRNDIAHRIIEMRPLYDDLLAAKVLGVSPKYVRGAIERKELGHVRLMNQTGKEIVAITGWQLIDYLEWLDGKNPTTGRVER